MSATDPILIRISADMLELSTDYLASRRSDVAALKQAFTNQEYPVIEKMIHKTKGTAGAYGFDQLGIFAKELELAAKSKDPSKTQHLISEIENYLSRVQIQA